MRLTMRGKCVAGMAWLGTAWVLADVLPFWWVNL